jgi:peptidoglycan/LPS O-acetylase OafA/YrhL
MSNSKETTRIAFLDYLRIFAFISVLIGHKFYADIIAAVANDKLHATPKLLLEWLMPFVFGGGAGVIVFFLVSGYIISQVLSLEQTTNFLIRRVFRIYPLYIAAVLIQILLFGEIGGDFSLNVLVPQLLLIGDFFGSPYTLAGVEWTLRIEVVFYVFMTMLKVVGFYGERKHLLIFVLLLATMLMSQLPAFPDNPYLFKGYFLIYAPFLFIGTGFWLYEKTWINFGWLLALICLVFVNYFYLISCYQPNWLFAQFAALGFLLFTTAWIFRAKFHPTATIILCSDLTYAVYLFHNWMFDFFKRNVTKLLSLEQNSSFLALLLLFAFCFLLHRIIERPANKLGRTMSLKAPELKFVKIK